MRLLCGPACLRVEFLFSLGESMFIHRTRGEVRCLEGLRSIPFDRLEAWKGRSCVDSAAWMWCRAQLQVVFRFVCKNGSY